MNNFMITSYIILVLAIIFMIFIITAEPREKCQENMGNLFNSSECTWYGFK